MRLSLDELNHRLDELVAELLGEEDGVELFSAEECGLDRRAAWNKLWVSDDFICCMKSDDGGLQYYGGFEYVDKELRREAGRFVFYFRGEEEVDSRVGSHIDHALNAKTNEEE